MAVAYPEQIPELFNRTAFDPETNEEDTKFYASLFAVLPEAVEIVREHSASQKKTFPGGMPLSPRPGAPTQARIGRNDPCPCGSGKKYKKCCLMNH
jgi:uncharacterized protein YecA (UPF0149 family)